MNEEWFLVSTTSDSKPNQKITWKDIYNMIDEPENRKLPLLKRIGGIKNQVIKLGGVRVIVFHSVTYIFRLDMSLDF